MGKILLIGLLFTCKIFAIGQYETIESNNVIYYEYFKNPKAIFHGNIIFENGSGVNLTEWTKNKAFINCAKQYGSIFLYDRNGLGKSSPDLKVSAKNPITSKSINDKLLILLKQAKINPPYLLVSHSYGGLY